ncbi:MAG: RnfABCDGE type electron transport complex subunit B [Dokdonella sp.]
MTESLADRIDALLPQTQCTRCDFPTCRAYADAIAENRAEINQCPPGGAEGVVAIADLFGREPLPLNPANGCEEAPTVAFIDEDVCIGCTKCIQACPVDAIVGAAKRMHTIIAAECTGCGLCLPPCPVDCIALLPLASVPLNRTQVLSRATQARQRFGARNERQRAPVGAAEAAIRAAKVPNGIAASAAPIELDVPTRPAASSGAVAPITRSAVLEAIARGKARRKANVKDSPTR